MAIGRISGPMLFSNLERQGQDLAIEGNLIYFDVTQRRVGINTFTPNVELDIVGSANITSNLFVGGTVIVGNSYMLPPLNGGPGQVLGTDGNFVTYWIPAPPESSIRRHKYEKTIDTLLGFGNVEFQMELGVSSIVYNLTVSRPVKVEVYSTPDRNENNPYTFIATPEHLTDDGTVVLNDGSSFQSRQYSIFANLEDPPTTNVFVTISSIDEYLAATPVYFSVIYFPAVTDSRPTVDVVDTLPVGGYVGKMVYLRPLSQSYLWVDDMWKPL